MTISVTLADANILVSRTLRDYFVYAAKLGALEIHWDKSILQETTRNLVKQFNFSLDDAEVLVDRLEAFLPSPAWREFAPADIRSGARDLGA